MADPQPPVELSIRLDDSCLTPPTVVGGLVEWEVLHDCDVVDAVVLPEIRFRYLMGWGGTAGYALSTRVMGAESGSEPVDSGAARDRGARLPLLGQRRSGERGSRLLRFPLRRAYPSVQTEVLQVEHRLAATVAAVGWPETRVTAPYTMLLPRVGYSGFECGPEIPGEKVPSHAVCRIRPASRFARPGDTVRGVVEITPLRDFVAQEVRAQVHLVQRRANTGSDRRIGGEYFVQATELLAKDVRFREGEPASYDFQVRVPQDAAPGCRTPFADVFWCLGCQVVVRKFLGPRELPPTLLTINVFNEGYA